MILGLLGYPERSHFLIYIGALCGALAIIRRSSTHVRLQKTETNTCTTYGIVCSPNSSETLMLYMVLGEIYL
jgi:hypothetical protein